MDRKQFRGIYGGVEDRLHEYCEPMRAPNSYTWVPLMDNWVGGGPLPAPSHLVTQFNATLNRTLPAGSDATRAMAGVGAVECGGNERQFGARYF
jgi:hypothetical protein